MFCYLSCLPVDLYNIYYLYGPVNHYFFGKEPNMVIIVRKITNGFWRVIYSLLPFPPNQ